MESKAAESKEKFDIENSPYVCIPNPNGDGVHYLKKSAVIWFLEHGVKKLSNDRCVRVAQTASFQMRQNMRVNEIESKSTLRLGDWCVFSKENIDFETEPSNNFLVGRILSMGYLKGSKKDLKKPLYEFNFTDDANNVGALCLWYSFDLESDRNLSGKLKETRVLVHGLHPCSTYLCSIPPPFFDSELKEMKISPPDGTFVLNGLMTEEVEKIRNK